MARSTIQSTLCLIIFWLLVLHRPCDANGKKKLVLILLDGFRWDYAKTGMPGFAELGEIGVRAEHLTPVFPSMSFPNYYSLATGLYSENHGIVMNYMYDAERQQKFEMLTSRASLQSFWWEEAEPIWITATKRGLRSHLYFWPGGNVVIHNTTVAKSRPYQTERGLSEFRNNLEDALQGLKHDEVDLVQIYCEHADDVGHNHGPNSDKMRDAVKEIDSVITEMLGKLRKLELINKVNVVIVSDHGMTPTDKDSVKRVSLDKYVDVDKHIRLVQGQGAVIGIFPKPESNEKVFNDLKKADEFEVWMKENIPEEFHIKKHARTPPILVLAKPGYFIKPTDKQEDKIYKGYHGYDAQKVPDMNGIFYGFGPGFESNMIVKPIKNVDVYNIMMHLLDLTAIPNNGSWTSVFKMIKSANSSASTVWSEGLSSVLAWIGCIYMYSLIAFVHSVWI